MSASCTPATATTAPDAAAPRVLGAGSGRALALVGGVVAATLAVGVAVALPAQAAPATTITMSTSTSPVTDSRGTTWAPASGFTGGGFITPPPAGTVIKGTSDPQLYRTAMFRMTGWSAPVANGSYTVTLKMFDPWYGTKNNRIFSVTAEGAPVLSNIDIAAAVGQYAAYDRSFPVTVSDGRLDLGFVATKGSTTVSAISVVPAATPAVAATTSTPAATVSPGALAAAAPTGSLAVGAPSGSAAPTAPAPTTPAPTSSAPGTPAPTTSAPTTPAPTSSAPSTPASSGSRPGPTNTGVPAGTVLTRMDGFTVLDVAGATYQNLDIHGRVRISAPNITLKNSIIRGDNSGVLGEVVDVNYPKSSHDGFTLMDSEIVPEFPQWQQDGILGHDYTVIRCNIHGTTDAVKVAGNNVTVRDSWLHDTKYFTMPGIGYGDTHNDGIQAAFGDNLQVINNTIELNKNSAIMLAQDAGMITNVTIRGNYMDGGGCSVNNSSKKYPTMGPITVTDNTFGQNQVNRGCAVIANTATTTVNMSGNVWDTGAPVTMSRGS